MVECGKKRRRKEGERGGNREEGRERVGLNIILLLHLALSEQNHLVESRRSGE